MSRNNLYLDLKGQLEKKLSSMQENKLLPPEQNIADEFGVSKPTLRRALQELADAGLIRKINGVGTVVVKHLKTISRELIFVCHDIVFFAETLKQFGAAAAQANYFISIVPLAGDSQTQERILASAVERKPAGLVIYGDPDKQNLNAFKVIRDSGIATLYLIRLPEKIEGNLLEFGNADGISKIVENFYEEGCRKIAVYADSGINPVAAREREEGFMNGMKRCRLKANPSLCVRRDTGIEEREIFLRLFEDAESRPDAVSCLNDLCAAHLITELMKRKCDISKVQFSGFDNSAICEFIPGSITTVEPPMAEMGGTAAEMLIRQIENPHFGIQKKKLHTRIIKHRTK